MNLFNCRPKWINVATKGFPASLCHGCRRKFAQDLLFASESCVAWRWDVDVVASEGKVVSPLAGGLFLGCAEGAVWWQNVIAIKKNICWMLLKKMACRRHRTITETLPGSTPGFLLYPAVAQWLMTLIHIMLFCTVNKHKNHLTT